MTKRALIGMLTPSSNTVLEPVATAMVAGIPEVSVHFGRFRVTEISLDERALGQFDHAPMLEAASLLADARVSVICWTGTSAGWMGLDRDRALCAAIAERTGIPATSSVLALDELMRRAGVRRYGLVTPYLTDLQERILANLRAEGYECVAECHLGQRVNFSFAEVPPETLVRMIREVAQPRPEAIVVLCTNLRGAPLAAALEREIGVPIYDSVAAAIWHSLRVAKLDPGLVRGWGRLFDADLLPHVA